MADGGGDAPVLVLGPLLRYVSESQATVWVETDRACEVEILAHRARTFEVAGHHYALVVIDGLRPGSVREYQVALDGTIRWPEPGSPFGPSVLRTLDPQRPVRLAFGSCRIAELPVATGRTVSATRRQSHGPDAMSACAAELGGTKLDGARLDGADLDGAGLEGAGLDGGGLGGEGPDMVGPDGAGYERWPDALFLIGDQVYADEVGPGTRDFIRQRRDPSEPPGYQIADFAEYCALYREAWSEPSVRWLLSVVPTAMIFDDHDVHDDWNISASWRRDFAAKPWWPARIRGAYMSYWIYQHLGNLSPAELASAEPWCQIRDQPGDAADVLAQFADRADQQAERIWWSYRRTFGSVRVVVIDSRAGRVLDEGNRRMIGQAEWRWVSESAATDAEHVVLATSLPLLLPPGIHGLEAWNEAVCAGVWGRRLAVAGERLRRAVDLEHWAAFGRSFTEFGQLLAELSSGAHGQPPASITVISGDVHHSYLAKVRLTGPARQHSAVYQAVCSPIHNMLPPSLRRMHRLATSRPGEVLARALARLAQVTRPGLRWRITHGPWFDNMLATLEFDHRTARIRFDRGVTDQAGAPRLEPVCTADLS